ncbi:MAG TPA: outer membrane beta-barrel protein [Edaphobacter sp.]|nr:outer membrane beta-barrel protein [Edaphobacter sp.]
MASMSAGMVALLVVVAGGVGFLLWVLYHFILESRQAAKRRNDVRHLLSSTPHRSDPKHTKRRLLGLIVLMTVPGVTKAQTPVSPTQDARVTALQQKVQALEDQLDEIKSELATLKNSSAKSLSVPEAAITPPPAAVAKPEAIQSAPKPMLPSILPAGSTLNVLFDGYYGYNFNHPPGRVNYLRAYDVLSNAFSLNQAAVVFELPADLDAGRRFGARLDLQFGQATATLQGNPANESRPDIYRNIFQAYGRYVAPVGKGLTLDFGKWASSLGYEANYTKDQLNYTRSFYFNYLPFYHMGLRANYPINDKIAVNYWLVNGTQQDEPFNSFKDEMFGFVLTPTKPVTWTVNYYLGQEHPDSVPSDNCGSVPLQPGLCLSPIPHPPNGRTHIFDSYVNWQARPKLLFAVEGDYLIQRLWRNAAPGESSAPSHVIGGAGYAQYEFNPRIAVAARAEYLSDRGGLFSGTTQALKETTGTFRYKFGEGFMGMAEYRRDWSNHLFFPSGTNGALRDHQDTATIGLVWWYGGKQGAW